MSKAVRVGNNRFVVQICMLFAAFVYYYFPTLKSLFHLWSTNDDYSYGFLIPLVSGYLLWERHRAIRETTVSVDWSGAFFFVLFFAVSLYGMLGSSPSAVQPTIPLVLLSIVLFCFGRDMLKVLFFPLAYLIFMIPLPTLVETTVGVPLKLISTRLGEVILRLSGTPVLVEGNVIDIGVTQLQVVDACGGLRFILPLLALGVIFAFFFERNRWKQAVLVLMTVPIAIATNGLRIGITGVLASIYGSGAAKGFFHGFSGWIVFMFAFALLFFFHFLFLKRIYPGRNRPADTHVSGREDNTSPAHRNPGRGTLPTAICCLTCVVLGTLSYSTGALPAMRVGGGLSAFPITIAEWQGRPEPMDPEIIRLSGAEEALTAVYTRDGKTPVSLYVGYRGSPFVGTGEFFHSPSVCLPSAGWKTITSTTHTIHDVPFFNDLTVAMMVIEKTGQKQLVYYWFQTKDRTASNVNINRFHLAMHAIKRDNTHDLFIRPITPVAPGETVADAKKRMDQFVRDMMAELLRFLKERQYAN